MILTLDRWGRLLPGLRFSQQASFIMLGLLILAASAVALLFVRRLRNAALLSSAATVLWMLLCGLSIWSLFFNVRVAGRWTSGAEELLWRTIPAYWILGTLFIWIVFAGRMFWRGIGGPGNAEPRAAFPVVYPDDVLKKATKKEGS
jgi:hypothetical protein